MLRFKTIYTTAMLLCVINLAACGQEGNSAGAPSKVPLPPTASSDPTAPIALTPGGAGGPGTPQGAIGAAQGIDQGPVSIHQQPLTVSHAFYAFDLNSNEANGNVKMVVYLGNDADYCTHATQGELWAGSSVIQLQLFNAAAKTLEGDYTAADATTKAPAPNTTQYFAGQFFVPQPSATVSDGSAPCSTDLAYTPLISGTLTVAPGAANQADSKLLQLHTATFGDGSQIKGDVVLQLCPAMLAPAPLKCRPLPPPAAAPGQPS